MKKDVKDANGKGTQSRKFLWCDESGKSTWIFVENEVGLDNYDLIIELWHAPLGESAAKLGEWKESVSELYDSIQNSSLQLHFEALLMSGKRSAGDVEVVLDVYAPGARHSPPLEKKSKLPSRRGKREMEKEDTFYLHVAAIGIVEEESAPCLKVISASKSTSCAFTVPTDTVKTVGAWSESFAVTTTPEKSSIHLELWSSDSQFLGQAAVFEAFAERPPCWRHIYGAAKGQKNEEAEEMARGRGGRSPSTFHASLFVMFSRFSGKIPNLIDKMHQSRKDVKLTVRLYRALYLDKYAGQKIQVLIKVMPGTTDSNMITFQARVDSSGVARFESPAAGKPAWVQSYKTLRLPEDSPGVRPRHPLVVMVSTWHPCGIHCGMCGPYGVPCCIWNCSCFENTNGIHSNEEVQRQAECKQNASNINLRDLVVIKVLNL